MIIIYIYTLFIKRPRIYKNNNIINNIIVQYLLIIHKKIDILEKDNKEIYYFPFLQK